MRALGRLSERPALAFRVMEEGEQAEVVDMHSGASVAFFGTFRSSSGGVHTCTLGEVTQVLGHLSGHLASAFRMRSSRCGGHAFQACLSPLFCVFHLSFNDVEAVGRSEGAVVSIGDPVIE
jgi:hypothetical protein